MTQIEPTAENGLSKNSAAGAFQVRSVSKERFVEKLGSVTEDQLADISGALAIVLKIYV